MEMCDFSAFDHTEADTHVAYSRVIDGKGKELFWLQEKYRPRKISFHNSPETKQQITEQNEMWEQFTKFLVDDFKQFLKDYKMLPYTIKLFDSHMLTGIPLITMTR